MRQGLLIKSSGRSGETAGVGDGALPYPPQESASSAGHSDLSFTKRGYVHPDPQSLTGGSDKLGELLAGVA